MILVKNQEPELYEIFKFWSFMESKSVNNSLQTASASADFVQAPTGASPLDATGDFRPPNPMGYSPPPPMQIPGAANDHAPVTWNWLAFSSFSI